MFASSVPAQPAAGSRFDVTNYHIEAQLNPEEHTLRAGADITFVPQDATRSIVFELNGALHVDSIEKDGKPLTSFVQDAVGAGAIGPNVRIDLGQVVPAGQPATVRIRWSGALASPEGGPLANKRLAYIGTEGSYLMYASRWFPFHDYAADRATADITIIVPDDKNEPVMALLDTERRNKVDAIVLDERRLGKWEETFPLRGLHPDDKLLPTSMEPRCHPPSKPLKNFTCT